MNTNQLKKFAKQARIRLLDDVKNRFLYWGLDKAGNVQNRVEAISGGYMFRGDVFNDESVPPKWFNLLAAVEHHTANDIIEEAAYTWFNRLMVIKILEENGFNSPILAYSDDGHDPVILQNAKRGTTPRMNDVDKRQLTEYLTQSKDDEALSLLLIHHCRNHQLLNKLFGQIDDYTELLLPNNLLADDGIISLLNSSELITDEDYKEVELIGWLYQFYISDKKDDVFAGFKNKKKARAEDIPAATQIFTPKWIVKYLVENTVGRIWLDKHPESDIRHSMKYLVEPAGPELEMQSRSYLGISTRNPIISNVTELKVLDPVVGSGHFLVVAFDLLMQMYKEEGYTNRYAVEAILKNNLFGLDICKRAVGLANFAVLLKAASYYPDILSKDFLPHIVAMPEPNEFNLQEIYDFLGEEGKKYATELQNALNAMQQAQNIGSALIIDLSANARNFIKQRLKALTEKQNKLTSFEVVLLNTFKPFLQPILLLTDLYPAVVANPPYMGSKNMNANLSNYVKKHYPKSKSDLFAVFMEVLPNRTTKGGEFGFITTPSWMFLSTFEKLRKQYLDNYFYKSLLHLSRGVFGADFGAVATVVEKALAKERTGEYLRLIERTFQEFDTEHLHQLLLIVLNDKDYKFDFSKYSRETGIPNHSNPSGKQIYYTQITQTNFPKIPGSPIAYWVSERVIEAFENGEPLKSNTEPRRSIQSGDAEKFIKRWTEVSTRDVEWNSSDYNIRNHSKKKWYRFANGGRTRKWYGNLNYVINWVNNGFEIKSTGKAIIPNEHHYFKEVIVWNRISSDYLSFRFHPEGLLCGDATPFLFTNNYLLELLCLLNSKVSLFLLNIINPTLAIQTGSIAQIPILTKNIMISDTLITDNVNTNINIAKKDWDSRETSWDFKQSPLLSYSSLLTESFNNWEEKVTVNFFQLHTNEEELNRIFINIYGLQDELTPYVPLKDITILQEELDRSRLELVAQRSEETDLRIESLNLPKLPIKKDVVIKQLLSYAIGCFMGRYRLDKPGLNIAHPNPTTDELSSYQYNPARLELEAEQSVESDLRIANKTNIFQIDDDGIIPIMGSESPFSDDIFRRVKAFVEIVWGEETLTENLNFINAALDTDLEKYLTTKFWDDHKKTYKKKPIYWQFSSPKGAFKVLAYMHRMNRFTVQKIRTNYLFKQLNYLEQQISVLESNESSLNNQESRKLDKLRSDLIECRDYDLLLKDFSDKQIEFDLDDGVTENYKLFEGVVKKI